MEDGETWKPVIGSELLYEISDLGRFRSLPKVVRTRWNTYVTRPGRIVKPKVDPHGYMTNSLQINNKQKNIFTHRLVAIAFIPNPENKYAVNHLNGIKSDNRVINLEWCTRSENAKHAFRIGLYCVKGEKHPGHKLTENDVLNIRDLYKRMSSTKIHRLYYPNLSYATIKDVIMGRRWTHI